TINDRKRQTTNSILLLPFEEAENNGGGEETLMRQCDDDTPTHASNDDVKDKQGAVFPSEDNASAEENEALHKLYVEYHAKGISKKTFLTVVEESRTRIIWTTRAHYVRGCLNTILRRRESVSYDEHLHRFWERVVKRRGT
ncbi:MAG: hypothetical protein ACRC5C_08800, partial [Bacilli bacterium]